MKKLGFGCMRLPLTNPEDPTSVDLEQFCEMIDTFMDNGFRYFDTAYPYHQKQSELFVKKALVERYPRNSFTLADKLPVPFMKVKEDAKRIFDEQLEKCGVNYFDYYLLHSLNRNHYQAALKFGCFDFIKKMKEGTDVYAKERAVLEENENERATLSLRESLKKDSVTELEEMVDECSLDEGQFPFALDDKWRGLVNKSGFYIQGNILVIDDARMRQHSKIIIKNVIS